MSSAKPTLEELYEQYGSKVRYYVKSRINNEQDVEDLCSDIFVKVAEKYDSFDPDKASVSTWLYHITHNTVIDHYRMSRASDELDEELSSEEFIEEEFIKREDLAKLAEGLKHLKQKDRDILVLHYYNGLSLKDVAAELHISYGGCRLRHNTALLEMKKFLEG